MIKNATLVMAQAKTALGYWAHEYDMTVLDRLYKRNYDRLRDVVRGVIREKKF